MSRQSASACWSLSAGLLVMGTALPAGPVAAQTRRVTVSGVVVETSRSATVGGATVRLSGSRLYVTDLDGRFRFDRVTPGAHTLTVEAFGYRPRSLELTVRADTVFDIELEPDPVGLDSLVVRAASVTVKGTVRDARNGRQILFAQVSVSPGARTLGAINGSFTIGHVPLGQRTTFTIQALEYLPVRIALIPEADTTLSVALEPDSVAIRMMVHQVQRLKTRAYSVPFATKTVGRDDLSLNPGAGSVYDLVRRRLGGREPATDCFFVDDVQWGGGASEVARDRSQAGYYLESLSASEVERVEIFANGGMIRVYTKQYVASLMGKRRLPPIMYGFGVCR